MPPTLDLRWLHAASALEPVRALPWLFCRLCDVQLPLHCGHSSHPHCLDGLARRRGDSTQWAALRGDCVEFLHDGCCHLCVHLCVRLQRPVHPGGDHVGDGGPRGVPEGLPGLLHALHVVGLSWRGPIRVLLPRRGCLGHDRPGAALWLCRAHGGHLSGGAYAHHLRDQERGALQRASQGAAGATGDFQRKHLVCLVLHRHTHRLLLLVAGPDRALLLGLGELAGRHAHATGGLHRPDPAVPAQHPDQGCGGKHC
mmetsp:Transcript_78512/g.188298  ORF Transcript_78512/g.188298 Transcript_78512/m.188298 type:complete len:255 (+) Transcript_78512:497-1261(+)